jgi:hypothetical protein
MKTTKIFSIISLSMIIGMVFSAFTGLNPFMFAAPVASYGFASHYFPALQLPGGSLFTNFGAITSMQMPTIDGREAMGGYTMKAYLILDKDIDTYPGKPDIETVTETSDLAKLTSSVVMSAGKYAYEVLVKPQTTKFTASGQGETGGKSFQPKIAFFIPGIDDYTMGLARMLNNMFGHLIIPDADGKHRIWIGEEGLPCEFKPSADSGAKAADVKGFTFEATTDSFAPGWIYEGDIPLSGSTLPGVS